MNFLSDILEFVGAVLFQIYFVVFWSHWWRNWQEIGGDAVPLDPAYRGKGKFVSEVRGTLIPSKHSMP